MRFCLEVWGTDYKIKETCILAEKLGYYGFYYGEALAHIDLDSRHSTIFYDGKFYRINGASPFELNTGARFTRTKIPITISAKKSLMLHLAVKFADIWEASYLTPQEFEVFK